MNKLRKLTCLLLALVMVFALATTASAADGTNKITIKNASDGHTYEAYQIFTGDYSEGKLSNIVWGNGVTEDGKTALQDKYDATTEGEKSAAGVAEALTSTTIANAFAKEVSKYLSETKYTSGAYNNDSYEISALDAGYYLVMDQAGSQSGQDQAYTAFILKVAGTVEVSPKSAKPTVDKLVYDEPADAEEGHTDGWGETADHAINESFQFKLIAKLPADKDFGAYDKYKVAFTDTMSAGVTFESIASVAVGGHSITDYTCTATAGQEGGEWKLTIEDIKTAGVDLTKGTEVVVIYNAHLNEKAQVNHESGSTTNKNTVSLEYSNNPNVEGLGKTPEDTVWVFTYEVDNTKYQNALPADGGIALADAGFRLYQNGQEVSLIYDTTLSAYRPTKGNETAEEMKSAADGKFNIVGLDAGTYTLKETTTPTGFNTCEDITSTISANHTENADGASATTTLTAESTMTNNIVNKSGSTLPETGGMGTTIFYVLGGVLVLAAVVLLVTKKRMRSEN